MRSPHPRRSDRKGRGTFLVPAGFARGCRPSPEPRRERQMHGLIYLIGLIVVIMAILSFFGLR
jgi:hypothetical protein